VTDLHHYQHPDGRAGISFPAKVLLVPIRNKAPGEKNSPNAHGGTAAWRPLSQAATDTALR